MTTKPRNPIEWLLDKVSYEQDNTELRNLALAAVMLLTEPESVEDVFQKEMEEDGYYDDEAEHASASDWLEDKEGWDMAIDLVTDNIKGKLGR